MQNSKPHFKNLFIGRFNAINSKMIQLVVIKDTVRNDAGLVYVCINYFGVIIE